MSVCNPVNYGNYHWAAESRKLLYHFPEKKKYIPPPPHHTYLNLKNVSSQFTKPNLSLKYILCKKKINKIKTSSTHFNLNLWKQNSAKLHSPGEMIFTVLRTLTYTVILHSLIISILNNLLMWTLYTIRPFSRL